MAKKKTARNSKKVKASPAVSYLDKIEAEVQSNQSRVSMILGVLIVIFAGILLFNYFKGTKSELGPSQATDQITDVTPDKLPGNYTVKDGDTLFTIAEKYYNDGYKYPEIAKANNLINVDSIATGQTLTIPKLTEAEMSPTPASTEAPTTVPSPTPLPTPAVTPTTNQPTNTEWGPAITENKYTVVDGDWLSKIADRAYGDPLAYDKLAKANNIADPDLIEPGMVLVITR
ncbi:MAG: LysM peptidoglycan-binding domain-containing protein [Candidatus Daviesbacteria bacterium]|nr:LysM peptidoglycan-binding domain-containing protein [Candidatus Daviesbacteria bacterium]